MFNLLKKCFKSKYINLKNKYNFHLEIIFKLKYLKTQSINEIIS